MLHVAILANLKKNAPLLPGQPPDAWADLDSERTIDALADSLRRAGHRATFLEANVTLIDTLREVKPDICFNIAEGQYGDSREAQVPALLELLRIPYTGSRVLTQAISLDKVMTKRVWQSFGLRTPPFQEFTRADEPLDPELEYPLFVKPAREGTGAGVSVDSVAHDEHELRERVDNVLRPYSHPPLSAQFLAGRALAVGVVGNVRRQCVFAAVEVHLSEVAPGEKGIYTHVVKSLSETAYVREAELPPAMKADIQRLVLDAHNAIGTLDVSRVDIRCDEDGLPYLLEINTFPGMSPGFSDLSLAT